MAEEKLTLTVSEAAKCLGISRGLAFEMVRQNRIPHLKFSRRILIPKKALFDLLEKAALDIKPSGEKANTGK
ncbi:MAG: helix-turn-helix domain-containing protein [Dehalococcoidales bacterium]